MSWLEGFEQKSATMAGGTFDGSPWRLVLHTTEGDSIEGAIASFAKTGSWPHLTVDPRRDRKIQHYPLSTSARALAHPKGSPETNRAGAIQVEIVGHAADTPAWGDDELDWLGREVVAPIRAMRPFPLSYLPFVGPEAGTIASARAPQRLTWADWATFSGICGHQHVPGNDHWDPGRLDVARIVAVVHPSPVIHEEGDLTEAQEKMLEDISAELGKLANVIRGGDGIDARLRLVEKSVGTELDKHLGEVRRNVRGIAQAAGFQAEDGTHPPPVKVTSIADQVAALVKP